MEVDEQERTKKRKRVAALAGVAAVLAVLDRLIYNEPIPEHTSIRSGALWYQELIDHPNPRIFKDVARMSKDCFKDFVPFLEQHGGLESNSIVHSGEKVMII